MKNSNTEVLQEKIFKLAEKINLPKENVPEFNKYPSGEVGHYLAFEDGSYHYIIFERSSERSRKTTNDEDLFLYWIFFDLTASHALMLVSNYPEDSSIDSQQLRNKRHELMAHLDKSWGQRIKEKLKL